MERRFSAAAFEQAGHGTAAARDLARQLQYTIQQELDHVVRPAMHALVAKLNELGHQLTPVGELHPGDLHFREPLDGGISRYKFLVAADIVISVGYPETVDAPPD